MTSAIKCPRCKQRISVSENERLLVCPMCKTQLDLPDSASGSVPPVIQPRQEPSTPIAAPQVNASQPFANRAITNRAITNQADQVNANQSGQNFGDAKQSGLADTHFDPPGSGSSFFFVLFLIVAMLLFASIFGVLVWLLIRAF